MNTLHKTLAMERKNTIDIGEHLFIVMHSGEVLSVFKSRQHAREQTDDDPEARYMIETEITGFYP